MRRDCSIRQSSPGYPKPGRRQKPQRLSHRASQARAFLRPSAVSRRTSASFRSVSKGQEFRPKPSVCSNRAGSSSGVSGNFKLPAERLPEQSGGLLDGGLGLAYAITLTITDTRMIASAHRTRITVTVIAMVRSYATAAKRVTRNLLCC